MTSFSAALRRMVQQYEAACSLVLSELKWGCFPCDRTTNSLPCDRCPYTASFEQMVRDRLRDSK